MTTCKNCQRKWTWKDIFMKSFTISDYFHCPHCGHKAIVSKRFRRTSNRLFFLMLFLILGGNFLFGPSILALIALPISAGAYFVTYPYLISFDQE